MWPNSPAIRSSQRAAETDAAFLSQVLGSTAEPAERGTTLELDLLAAAHPQSPSPADDRDAYFATLAGNPLILDDRLETDSLLTDLAAERRGGRP